eukprot:m.147827 g.147827  ORF g.147827 m.147827 type:complete len:73 (-) comp16119_c1_seq1:193-411(-)
MEHSSQSDLSIGVALWSNLNGSSSGKDNPVVCTIESAIRVKRMEAMLSSCFLLSFYGLAVWLFCNSTIALPV